eukprot:6210171-Pleurochrysis_carterae.AAC.1
MDSACSFQFCACHGRGRCLCISEQRRWRFQIVDIITAMAVAATTVAATTAAATAATAASVSPSYDQESSAASPMLIMAYGHIA